ncbi:MAG: hypothetical protein WBC45_06090 [Atribacterota bacterium]
MKKSIYLIMLMLIFGLVLAGCVEILNPLTPTLNITKNGLSLNNEGCLNLTSFTAGQSVEGMDTVYTGLNIYTELITPVTNDGLKEAVVIVEGVTPRAYGSHPSEGSSIINGCLGNGKGIAIQRNTFPENDLYNFVFQFSEGMTVSSFSLNMLDFGDYNQFQTTSHSIALVAYDADGIELIRDTLSYNSDSGINPTTSTQFGNLQNSGDACRAIGLGGNLPGNYTFNVNHSSINKVALELDDGPDSYFGIRNICFTPTPEIKVPVDIKPTSCPNPLNVKSQGVLPVAILGTEDFDVNEIDPSTILLEGVVSPVKWAFEDVATPYEPIGIPDCRDCSTIDPDGYLDLILHFNTQDIINVLENENLNTGDIVLLDIVTISAINDGACVVLTLNGELFSGNPIKGEDSVVILKKGKL